MTVTVHTRLVALARDPEIPSWCRWAIGVGFLIVGPFDEVVIYPAVVAFVYLRRRHVLERHGFAGAHVLAALAASLAVVVAAGIGVDLLIGMVRG